MNQIEQLMPKSEEVVALYRDGVPISAIARRMGTQRHAVTGVLSMNGVELPSRGDRRTMVLEYLREHPGVSKSHLAQRFGVHHNTITSYLRGTPEEALLVQNRDDGQTRRYSDEDILDSMREVWDGLSPKQRERGMSRTVYDRRVADLTAQDGRPRPSSALLIQRRYPTWRAVCQAAGVRPGRVPVAAPTQRYRDEDLVRAVADYVAQTGETSYAGYARWAQGRADRPSAATVRIRYGRWSAARRAALSLAGGGS